MPEVPILDFKRSAEQQRAESPEVLKSLTGKLAELGSRKGTLNRQTEGERTFAPSLKVARQAASQNGKHRRRAASNFSKGPGGVQVKRQVDVKGDGKRNCLSNKNRPGQGAALIEFVKITSYRFSLFQSLMYRPCSHCRRLLRGERRAATKLGRIVVARPVVEAGGAVVGRSAGRFVGITVDEA